MANLKEQIEAYANYLITVGVTAIVAVGGTIGVQSIYHRYHPVMPAENVAYENFTIQRDRQLSERTIEQLQQALHDLNGATAGLETAKNRAQEAVPEDPASAQYADLKAAFEEASNALMQHNAEIANTQAELAAKLASVDADTYKAFVKLVLEPIPAVQTTDGTA